MMEVRDVLRRILAGQGLREIARQTGIDRKTVRLYAEAAKDVTLSADTKRLLEDGVIRDKGLARALLGAWALSP